nr:hypothetical protein [Tanacetum cinerariifolium]
MSRVKCYNCKKEGHFARDCKKAKVKDYEYYKTKMVLAKKEKDDQVLLTEDQAWMESSSDSDQEINANMVFMAQIEKVLSDSEASSSSADENIFEGKDGTGKDVDLHLYRSMIGSLMYLTASRPDIMFAVCACARHQVTPKECHLHATIVSTSKTEAEYVTAASCCGQVLWIQNQLLNYG